MSELVWQSTITFPACGHAKANTMPANDSMSASAVRLSYGRKWAIAACTALWHQQVSTNAAVSGS